MLQVTAILAHSFLVVNGQNLRESTLYKNSNYFVTELKFDRFGTYKYWYSACRSREGGRSYGAGRFLFSDLPHYSALSEME